MNPGRVAIVAAGLLSALPAHASIMGEQGVEIRGPYDRRGFYWKPTGAFGAQFPGHSVQATTVRLDLEIGAGASKNVTVGVQGGPAWVIGDVDGIGIHADIVVRGYLTQGFFLQAGGGVAPTIHLFLGVPTQVQTGVGGQLGLGYEIWTGATNAFGIAFTYDGRFDRASTLVSGVIGQVYLVFY